MTTTTGINFDLTKFGFELRDSTHIISSFEKVISMDEFENVTSEAEVKIYHRENKMMVRLSALYSNTKIYDANLPENQAEADILFKLLGV